MQVEGEEGSLETSTGIRIEAQRGHAAVEKIEKDYKIGEWAHALLSRYCASPWTQSSNQIGSAMAQNPR